MRNSLLYIRNALAVCLCDPAGDRDRSDDPYRRYSDVYWRIEQFSLSLIKEPHEKNVLAVVELYAFVLSNNCTAGRDQEEYLIRTDTNGIANEICIGLEKAKEKAQELLNSYALSLIIEW